MVMMQAEKKVVLVTRSGDEYHARYQGASGIWGAGKNPYCAIGNMVSANPEVFGIEITLDKSCKSDE